METFNLLIDERFVLLYGVLIGWALNSVNSYFKYRTERNVKLGRVIFKIIQIRDAVRIRNNHMNSEALKDLFDMSDANKFEKVRASFNSESVLPMLTVDDSILLELAEIDPFRAYVLQSVIDNYVSHIKVQKTGLEIMLGGTSKEYFDFLLTTERAKGRYYEDIQRIVDGLCWKFGALTYANMKFKVSQGPNEPPFTEAIEMHLKKLKS